MEIIEDDDGVVATIPDLPGCNSFGDTVENAVRSLNETKELWIKGRADAGLPIPEPTRLEDFSGKFVLRIPRSLHKSLDREAKKQGVSLNQYILHLLSERHAVTKIEDALKGTVPFFGHVQHSYYHAKDIWVEQARICRYSISTHAAESIDSTESLLGMLDFFPKQKGFRKILPSQKELRTMYQGKL